MLNLRGRRRLIGGHGWRVWLLSVLALSFDISASLALRGGAGKFKVLTLLVDALGWFGLVAIGVRRVAECFAQPRARFGHGVEADRFAAAQNN